MSFKLIITLAFISAMLLHGPLRATDVYFNDSTSQSQNGRYEIRATSPDNAERPDGVKYHRAFQSDFLYECIDTTTGATLWSRRQPMQSKEESGIDEPFPKEGSPASLFISNDCETVIFTGWQELIIVNARGQDIAKIKVLGDLITKAEEEKYVAMTTAGPMWESRSHWYFREFNGDKYFIIRPWWGRHMIINVRTGEIVHPDKALRQALLQSEQAYVLDTLSTDNDDITYELNTAIFIAGVLPVADAIPLLRTLESNSYIGSSTIGGGLAEVPQGAINPANYRSFTIRQSVHLALRRLGERPGPYPTTQFVTEHDDHKQQKPYGPEVIDGKREERVRKIHPGMTPKQVIDLLGAPDYCRSRGWEYDMDTVPAYTLIISWNENRQVSAIDHHRPARWQDGDARNY